MTLYIVSTGLFLLILAPLVSRWTSRDKSMAISMSGLFLVVLALIVSVLTGQAYSVSFWISSITLVWAILVYVVSEIRFRRQVFSIPDPVQQNCVPEKYRGEFTRIPATGGAIKGSRYFDGIGYAFQCSPTNSSLHMAYHVRGKTYWVLIAFRYEVKDQRSISIECEAVPGGCQVSQPLSKKGPTGGIDGALTVAIGEDIIFNKNTVSISVDMAAGLSGNSVKITGGVNKGGVKGSLQVTIPGADVFTGSVDMGTYAWRCNGKGLEVEEPGVSDASTGGPAIGGGVPVSEIETGASSNEEDELVDEPDCAFDQELTLVSNGPKDGTIKFDYTISIRGTQERDGSDTTILDRNGRSREDYDLGIITVDDGCINEFTYLAKFDFEVFDENDNSVGTGSDEVDYFFRECAGDQTLTFVTRIGTTTIDGFLKIGPLECV